MSKCGYDGCERRVYAKNLCTKHYQRLHRNGSTETLYGTAMSRFLKKVRKTEDCWQWKGAITKGGYGLFWKDQKNIYAHRFSFGDIPDGLVIDHLCRNRSCVNPSHMEVVTQRENILRGAKCNKELIWKKS